MASEPSVRIEEESSELITNLTRTWDYEESGHQIPDVQGRLTANIKFWEQESQAPSLMLDWIRQGYKLPLLSLPDFFERNQH